MVSTGSGLIRPRDDDEIPQCTGWDASEANMPLRIASVFIILTGSLLGVLLPMMLARAPTSRIPKAGLFVAKYLGSGVILATAFIHLLSPANKELNDPCLGHLLPDYDFAQGIALMTVVVMFFVELLAARFDFGFGHSHGHDDSNSSQKEKLADSSHRLRRPHHDLEEADSSRESNLPTDLSYPPGGEDHLGHQRDHVEGDSHTRYGTQLTALLILEFGVVFHSFFIGLTLAGTKELTILLIVISFHQFFEGLGLGSRLATAHWPADWKKWTPLAMAIAYGVTTPLGIAIGLGVMRSLASNPAGAQLANGVFDAISAGILLYTGLVELLAHEFMFNPEMRSKNLKIQMSAFGCVVLGAAIMALLGKWA